LGNVLHIILDYLIKRQTLTVKRIELSNTFTAAFPGFSWLFLAFPGSSRRISIKDVQSISPSANNSTFKHLHISISFVSISQEIVSVNPKM
jgi:hypothetical protein